MPSSGYVADSFIAGEQPSTAKWNELWGNDASFNSGNGFNDGILVTRHFATNAVDAPNMTTGAIKLAGIRLQAADQTGISTSETLLNLTTGTSLGYTVPAGGRDILFLASASLLLNTTAGGINFRLKNGGTVGSTNLATWNQNTNANSRVAPFMFHPLAAPTAGAATTALTAQAPASATIDVANTSIYQGWLAVYAT